MLELARFLKGMLPIVVVFMKTTLGKVTLGREVNILGDFIDGPYSSMEMEMVKD
ncbi:hypothetical protein AVEN_12789-2-1, partial [Araneus ventricosus]